MGRCLDEESVEDLTEAYGCFAAEKYACSYLESREQGRFMLTQKLLKKGYEISLYLIVAKDTKLSEVVSEVQKQVAYMLNKVFGISFSIVNVFIHAIK